MIKCRTSFQPWQELEVDEAEYKFFKDSGLLVGDEENPNPTDPAEQGSAE